ncbi:MAG: TetR/AcrR family transcriptional regulator [Pseudonocardiaceae bacterium]
MSELVEHDSVKAARILSVARELVLKRGVRGITIAEIAEKAHVGKGTVYLYWRSKEDLLVGLVARDFLAVLDETAAALTAAPDAVRPAQLCVRMVRTALLHPFVSALHTGDTDLLGLLAGDSRSQALLSTFGPGAQLYVVLPLWRRYDMARTDWTLDDQVLALRAVTTGFLELTVRHDLVPDVPADVLDRVVPTTVTALLGPDRCSEDGVRAAADEGLGLLAEMRRAALATMATPT